MILQNYKVPNVYATPYTAKRLQQELSNAGIDPSEWPEIYAIAPGKPIAEGPVSVTAFWVSHSTPQSAGFFIETPKGNILHPGDFKTDQSVLWGPAFNETEFRRIASKPVDLLLLDSTGSEKDTAPVTEEDVRETLRALVKENANKRLIVAVMSGYEETLASVAMVTAESDRTLWIAGSAHEQTLSALADTGMSLSDHLGRAADVRILGAGKATRELAESPPRKSVVVVTGAQGHANAVLTRAADGHYPAMQLNPKTDVIIICAPPMPGQEGQREKLLATLRGKGFKVLTRDAETALYPHAHARLSEIVDLVKMADPKNILPIHGSGALRKSCAEAMGKAGRKVVEADNGDVLDVSAAGVLSVNPPTKGNPCLIGFKTLQGANNWRDRHYLMTSVPGENPSAEKRPANGNRKYRPTILNIKKS